VLVRSPGKRCGVVWVVLAPLAISVEADVPCLDVPHPVFQLLLGHFFVTILVNFVIDNPEIVT